MAWVTPVVEIAFATRPLDTPTYVDVTADVRGAIEWGYGRGSEFDQANPGQASFVLDNRARKYDPSNTASTYAGNLRPRRKVRITVSGTTVFTGYVNGWNQSADYITNDATVEVTALDPLTVLAQAKLPEDVYYHTIKAAAPVAWWRLDDVDTSILKDQMAGAHAQSYNSKYDGDTDFGKFSPWEDGRYFTGGNPSSNNLSTVYLNRQGTKQNPFADYVGPSSFECWLRVKFSELISTLGTEYHILRVDNGSSPFNFILCLHEYSPTDIRLCTVDVATVADRSIKDQTWHHIAFVTDGTNVTFYQDGVNIGTKANPSGLTYLAQAWSGFQGFVLGGSQNIVPLRYGVPAHMRDVALYSRALTAAEVKAHYDSATGFPLEATGTRAGRVLDLAGWPAAERVIDTGNALMLPESKTPTGNALSYLQSVAESEGGLVFAQPDGKIRFRARHYANEDTTGKTIQATYDDDTASTLHFVSVKPAPDDQFIFNEVTASGGSGKAATFEDTGSIGHYLRRTKDLTGLKVSDAEAYSRGEGILRRYSRPDNVDDAVILNGTTDYGKFTFTETPAGGVTIACWCRPVGTGVGAQAVMALNTAAAGAAPIVYWAAGGVSRFTLFTATPSTTTNEVASGRPAATWYHLTLTLSGTTATLYVNGVQVAQNTGIGPLNIPLAGYTLSFGQRFFGGIANLYAGGIDEAQYFDRVLSGAEITTLAGAQSLGDTTYQGTVASMGPYAWWRMNEGYGSAMLDSSGNGHHATYFGTPTFALKGVTFPVPWPRLDEVVINPRYSSAQLADAIARRVGDNVRVQWKQNASGAQAVFQGHIESYRHRVDLSELTWEFSFNTQPNDLERYLAVGDTIGTQLVLGH